MTLAERIHARMVGIPYVRRRMKGVPPAVIEEVLALGIEVLTEFVPMGTRACDLMDVEFSACEACGHLVDPENPEGATYSGEDGIWMCDACAVEAEAAEP